jgi:uncharacterized protein (TIGR02118 family)
MIKTIAAIARRPDVSHEDFVRHWVEVHAPLVRAVPGVRRYVQDHVVSEHPAPNAAPIGAAIDGFAELWFDDRAAMDRAFASPEGQALAVDGALFIGRITFYAIDEKIMIPHEA